MSVPPEAICSEHSKGELETTVPVIDRWFGSWRFSLHRRAFSASELKDTYDEKAATWPRVLQRFGIERAYETATQQILRRGELSIDTPNCRILDCGSGDGAFASAIARTFPVHISVVDISSKMLACASHRLSASGLEAEFHLADSRRLPFAEDTFSVVVTAHMLEHLANPEIALREITRVLKPGGVIIASITRRSLIGRWIQLKWRTHTFSRRGGERLFRDQGLQAVWSLPTTGNMAFDCFSIIYAARKPISLPQ